jgi:FSR family fosmidomycin resistance protein-like MFS transporter
MAQDFLPGKLEMVSGLMIGFAIGIGGIGVTLLGLVTDTWRVPTALKTMTVLPIVGFLLCLFSPVASFYRFGSS